MEFEYILPIILATIVILFVAIVAMRPAEFRIARSTTIAAPAADVFPQVNDFHNWDAWSLWAKRDSAMTKTAVVEAKKGG